MAVYFLLLVGIMGSLAAYWRFLAGLFLSNTFEGVGIDKPQETPLYVFWGVLEGFILARFIPITESYQRDVIWRGALNWTIGFWFVLAGLRGVDPAVLGILVVIRGGVAGCGSAALAAVPKTSEYDNIG